MLTEPLPNSTLEPDDHASSSAERAGDGNALTRNLGALAGGQLVTWTMTLLWTLVVPRVLGPSELGLIVSAISVSGVLALALGLGTRAYLVREIVVDRTQAPKLIGTAIVMRVALAPLVGGAAVVFAREAHYGAEARTVLFLATAMTIFGLLAEPLQAGLQAIERMHYLAYTDIINKTAQSVVGIAVVLIGLRAIGVMADMAAAACVVIFLNHRWLRPFIKVDLRTTTKLVRSVARGSLTYWASGMFSMIYLWIDTVMLSLMTYPRIVGWYGVTTTLFQTFLFIPVMVTTAWLPRLVAEFSGGRDVLMKAARVPVEIVMVTGVPVASLVAMLAPLLIHTVYGPAYAHAVPVMIVLMGCLPWMYLNIVLYTVFVAMKRAAVWTFVMVGAAFVNPAFNLFLIPAAQHRFHNGALGAAASMVLTEFIMDLVGLALLGSAVLCVRSVRRWGRAVVAAGIALACCYLTRHLTQPISPAVGVSALVILSLALRVVTAQELLMMKPWIVGLRRRLSRPSRIARGD